jgi:hypothetical protein
VLFAIPSEKTPPTYATNVPLIGVNFADFDHYILGLC